MPAPKVSVITVICGNNIEFMGKCLISLLENTNYANVEFIVVSDAEYEMTRFISNTCEYNASVKYIFREHKSSNSSNRNLGALHSASDSKYLLFADSDVLYTNNQWLTNLVQVLEEHSEIGIIGGGDGTTLGHFCWIDNETGILINDVMDFNGVMPDHPVEMMIIPGYNMLFRKDIFEYIGRWDEGFVPVYGEDIDICIRCILAGYKVYGVFNDGVKHLYRTTNENNSSERLVSDRHRVWLTVASLRRLAIKYRGILGTSRQNSYSEWVNSLSVIAANGQTRLANIKMLPPVSSNGKLEQMYLPTKDTSDIAEIFSSLDFS